MKPHPFRVYFSRFLTQLDELYQTFKADKQCIFMGENVINKMKRTGSCPALTLGSSGEDLKTTLVSSGEDPKTTLETSVEDVPTKPIEVFEDKRQVIY